MRASLICVLIICFNFTSFVLPMKANSLLTLRKCLAKQHRSLCMTNEAQLSPHLFSVAPMMDYTDRHQRTLQRIMSKKSVLYTEMVTSNAIVRSGTPERFLYANLAHEDPVVLQLGGSDPAQMKEAAKIAHTYGYKEINLNIGCPSERVSGAGCFGAVLYHTPQLVSELALAVGEATGKAATVKCRIGTDGHETYEELCNFIRTVSERGNVTHFIVHARIAVLGAKFSPKDNRTIPPLKYNVVFDLLRDFPHLQFSLNGGVGSLEQVSKLLSTQPRLHGVMVGRAVVNNPFAWSTVDSALYNCRDPGLSRLEVLQQYAAYTTREEKRLGTTKYIRHLTKPVQNLFSGEHNGKLFRQRLDAHLIAATSTGMSASEALLRAAECLVRADGEGEGEGAESSSSSRDSNRSRINSSSNSSNISSSSVEESGNTVAFASVIKEVDTFQSTRTKVSLNVREGKSTARA